MRFTAELAKALVPAATLALVLAGCSTQPEPTPADPGKKTTTTTTPAGPKVKIAFLVKDPSEPWFQLEWKFADEAATKDGFELIKIGVPKDQTDQLLPKIENAAAQGAKGLVICSPDVKLGPAIVKVAKERDMKLMSVDDQLVGADGKPLDVPHLGISARKIGGNVGEALMEEMGKRKWNAADTGLLVVTFDEVDTTRQRTEGEVEGAKGFPEDHVFRTPQKTQDVPGGLAAANIVLTQHPEIKHWMIAGPNDTAVIGAVRATEQRGLGADNVLGIGINGSEAVEEFKKDKPTGVFGTILLQAKRHGYETADAMFNWVTKGTEPEKVVYTDGILLTRDNYKKVMAEQGLTP